ncbi:MAG: CHAT domain-containing protein [Acidobacteriota bacterium]
MDRKTKPSQGIFHILLPLIILLVWQPVSSSDERLFSLERAEEYYSKGRFEKALADYQDALIKVKKSGDEVSEITILLKISQVLWNLGKMDQAEEYCRKASELASKHGLEEYISRTEILLEIHQLYNQGKEKRRELDYSGSRSAYEKAIQLARKFNLPEYELKLLRQLSITEYEDENSPYFQKYNMDAIKIARKIKHQKEEARCLNNLGLFYWKMDNYSKALSLFEDALKTFREINDLIEESNCLNNIGIIHLYLGNFDNSLGYLFSALEIDEKINNTYSIISDLNQIGIIYRNKGLNSGKTDDFYKALNYFYEAIRKINNDLNYAKLKVKILNNIGSIQSILQNNNKALQYFQDALEIAHEIQDEEAMGMIINNMGIVHYNLGNYQESTRYYQQAIKLALGIQRGQILWEAYLELAKAYEKQGQLEAALDNYRKSIDIIENIRSQIELEEFKARYLATDKRLEAYHSLINLMVLLHESDPDKGYDQQAFYFLEKAKARAFLDSLELSKFKISQGVDMELQNREKELTRDISLLYTKLLAAELSAEEKESLQKELWQKEELLQSLKREIRSKNPAYADLKYPEISTLEEARKLLDKKTAFLAYCLGQEKSLAFFVTRDNLSISVLPSRSALQEMVRDHLKRITDKENQDFSSGKKLFESLIGHSLNKNIRNLLIIPDDILHYLPFETILQEPADSWLVEDFNISYAPSVSSLREITNRKIGDGSKKTADILAVGDPFFGTAESDRNDDGDIFQDFYSSSTFRFFRLRYSNTEIERIKSLFGKKARTFVRLEASENNIKKHNLRNYKILHFATHSLIDDKVPERSAIILSLDGDPADDGFLQMREIYNLQLNADLVTLSSCQTGLGELIRGEGIEGLNRAFFFAGTSSVLMSLWAVNDQATFQLMERFYYHLRSGGSISSALRQAKLEMVQSDVLSHPYYWAGFIVSGQANQPVFPKTNLVWLLIILSLLGLGALVLLVLRKVNGKAK